ncbi:hypothetical protein L0U85_12175 [Glycomyces sp. L485]|uniref:hypothetical protein n=1 Tax=Glycomyces sp. L485 TaxID=2909235 RepID=UPI001F4A65B0|nr:hypothetical protein [Glycomyces sp. L485]MCH7231601.1 hypothetical protein [Glycomyces sp. L485]
MSGIMADPEKIHHAGRYLKELAEDVEAAADILTQYDEPALFRCGAAEESSMLHTWRNLRDGFGNVLEAFIENLQEHGEALQTQADAYDGADAASASELDRIAYDELRTEFEESEADREDTRVTEIDDTDKATVVETEDGDVRIY